jgi:hypothetical protein
VWFLRRRNSNLRFDLQELQIANFSFLLIPITKSCSLKSFCSNMIIRTKLRGWKLRNEFEKMLIIYLPVIFFDYFYLTFCIVGNNFEIAVLNSRCFRMQLFCILLNSGDESPMDHYYHAGWINPWRNRWSLSCVIATVKITTWKPISPPYYPSEHCISPRENEQNVVLKISYASHSREHKILCMT